MRDRGQAVPLVVALVAVVAVAIVALGHVGVRLVAQQRAQSGADAAALAAVVGGRPAAERCCRRNGCVVTALVADAGGVTVTVEVDGVRARARARDLSVAVRPRGAARAAYTRP